jgi:poly(A) polymerase
MAGTSPGPPLPNLAGARWLADPALLKLVAVLRAAGEMRAVGGAVRDTLLGRPVRDADFATPILPDDVMGLARRAGLGVAPTGLQHGTVTVISGGRPFEITTLRRDVASDGRRAKVAFTADWREDAGRRDFTMNAIYAAIDGQLFDPVGGLADLRARRVRFIGRPESRIAEDYLRILRFFRIHAEIGSGAPDGEALAACRTHADGLAGLSGERVRHEVLRLLAAPGAVAAARAMAGSGVIAVLGLGPANLDRLARLTRIEAALGRAPDGLLRLAALAPLRADIARLADRLRLSNAERGRMAAWRTGEGLAPRLKAAERDRLHHRLGDGAFAEAAILAWAGTGADEADKAWRALARLPKRRPLPRFPVGGADLAALGYREGQAMGAALEHLKGVWVAEGFRPGRAALLALARRDLAAR